MQIFSWVLDAVASKYIRESAQDLLTGPIPDDFNPDALNIIKKFAGDIEEFKEIFRVKLVQQFGDNSEIWKRIERSGVGTDEFTIAQRDDFIYQFIEADQITLKELNDDGGKLIEIWKDIRGFEGIKKEISFLKELKFIKDSDNLDKEVFKGAAGKRLKDERQLPPYNNNDYKWYANGPHHYEAIDVSKGGKARTVTAESPVGPSGLGYYEAKVEIYNPEYPYSQNSTGEIGWKLKNGNKGVATFFPKMTKQRLQQELALAFRNRIYCYSSGKSSVFKGVMSDGVDCIIYLTNDKIASMYPSFK